MKIGILALQGAFLEHSIMLRHLGVKAAEVRLPSELNDLDGLIIPGGESTTISRLMKDYGLYEPIKKYASRDFPIFGTCAGMILLAKKAGDLPLEPLGILGIEVQRNAFGRQKDSFETSLSIPAIGGEETFPGVFIRAPIIDKVEPGVMVLCQLNGGTPVAVRQKKVLACAFHPELTDDPRFHAYFLQMVKEK